MTSNKYFEVAEMEHYLDLDGVIARLDRDDPDRVVPLGFANPHSFRGYYDELAFTPVRDITVGDMLIAARSALGSSFEGYKGGTYFMHGSTSCWISTWGNSGDNKLGPLLLELMLGGGA